MAEWHYNGVNIIKMRKTVEGDLLGNNFPYPEYFDGEQWNTITRNTRSCIPSYLKEELPNMRFQKVKAKFQKMNRFMPPEITYFEKMITSSRNSKRRPSKSARQSETRRGKSQQQIEHLRQDLQYALVMTNRNSRILVDIVDKVSKAERKMSVGGKTELSFERKLMETKRSQSQQLGRSARECFRDTVDLVFSVKKKQCASRMRQDPQLDIREQIKSRINSIRLRTLEAD